jgi:radical SAM protein with 4Fe4S-binding SPASM domain
MCPQNTIERRGKTMSFKDIKTIVEQAVALGVARIQPHLYGESHLHPQYGGILAMISENYPEVTLTDTTNGSSLTNPDIAESMAIWLDGLSISLDGIKPETIEHIRPGLDGQAVLDGVKAFIAREHRPRVAITTVVMDCNRDEVDKIKALILDGDVHDACEMSDLHGYNPQAYKPLRDSRPCSRPFRDLCVNVEGDVILCCRDYNSMMRFGNAFDEGGLEAAWNSSKMRALRRAHVWSRADSYDICEECTYTGYWKGPE